MDYNRIVAVTGMPGLYEVVSSKTDGAIVRSLEDQSTKFVSSRVHNLSHLESIEVYTSRENVRLSDVFSAMKSSSEPLPDIKDNNALKSYFEKVYPELDFERVYASDMKKMIRWYEVVQSNDIDFTVKEETSEEEPVLEETSVEEVAVKKPAAKKAAKPKAEKEAKPKKSKEEAPEETDKPKRGRKKKTEE